MADKRTGECRVCHGTFTLRRSDGMVRNHGGVRVQCRGGGMPPAGEVARPASVEAAEIARGRIYDRWKAGADVSTAAVRRLIREAFEAGERHQEAWAALRTVEKTWIAPDEVPVDQR